MDFAELSAIGSLVALVGGFLLGAIVGSYLATLAVRWPAGRPAAWGRSRCDACAAPLAAAELVPLVSFVVLRGRCRRCKAAIDARHPAIELAAALIGALSLWLHPNFAGLAGALFGWILLLLAVLDTEHFWLPDRLTLPLIVLGLASSLLSAPSPGERAIGAAAGFLTFAAIGLIYRLLARRDGLGLGDAKLLAAIGAWLGWQMLPLVVLGACLTGFASLAFGIARGRAVGRHQRLPLGALMAVTAWPLWLARDAIERAMGI